MKILIVGLGSMGKRRVRSLKAINQNNLAGFDLRKERVLETSKIYKITPYHNFQEALKKFKPDALVISTSPKYHMKYALSSAKKNIPCFIEASVCNLSKIKELNKKFNKSLIAPSCTMLFNDGIEKISNLLKNKSIGDICFIKYHVGQYLPDWHPWEKKGHYVWEKNTNGCKELIPFELTWLSKFFGKPKFINSTNLKLSDLKINFNDTSNFTILFNKKILANITIEVLSKPISTRELIIIGKKGKIIMSADQGVIKYINSNMKKYKSFQINKGKILKNYINSELPYIKEMKSYMKFVKNPKKNSFPNNLSEDIKMLKLTNKIYK
tara:strand:+ start:1810 stop:2784 length:975 start_codon:yes stop_codon:yes gene_type:complete